MGTNRNYFIAFSLNTQSIIDFFFENKDHNLSDFRRQIDILVDKQTAIQSHLSKMTTFESQT